MTAEIPASVKPFSIIRPDASECRYSIAATIIRLLMSLARSPTMTLFLQCEQIWRNFVTWLQRFESVNLVPIRQNIELTLANLVCH